MKKRTQYWVAPIAAIAAILVVVHIVGIARRNAQYRAILKTYSDVLRPGMKRSEVKNYFIMSKYVSFDRGASEDTVEIARERAGWVCGEQVVYLTFEFDAGKESVAQPLDRLVLTSLNRSVCLDLP